MSRLAYTFVFGCAMLAGVSHAIAQVDEGSKPQSNQVDAGAPAPTKSVLSKSMGQIKWGMTSQGVIAILEDEVGREWSARKRTPGRRSAASLMREKKRLVSQVRRGFVQIGGADHGYESSVVAKEVLANHNESMLALEQKERQRYFFFKSNRLWKFILVEDSSAAADMQSYSASLESLYGPPLSEQSAKIEPCVHFNGLVFAWQDVDTTLILEDRRELFNAYLRRYVQRGVGDEVEAEHARRKGADSGGTEQGGNDPLSDIMGGVKDTDDDVVDELTGVSHEVVLDEPGDTPVGEAPSTAKSKKDKTSKRVPAKGQNKAKKLRESKRKERARRSKKRGLQNLSKPKKKKKSGKEAEIVY